MIAWRAADTHVARCASCHAELAELAGLEHLLHGVPSEALLEGPPEAADLLMPRVIRTIRAAR